MKDLIRCPWCLGSEKYMAYHDKEWGIPVHDDRIHFEFIVLEGAQAGLSWSTILNKREGYARLFSQFNPAKVARFSAQKLEKILLDPGIVRNRLKVYSTVSNAKRFLKIQKEFGSFDAYIWKFVKNKAFVTELRSMRDIRPTTPESDALSKDLIARGFKFTGSTVMYAHMQACGLVNDHLVDCFRFKEIQALPKVFPKSIKSKHQ